MREAPEIQWEDETAPRLDADALARAAAITAILREEYPALAAPAVNELRQCWTAINTLIRHRNLVAARDRDRFYRLAHDIKGHGGSYGYPLVSAAAASLCGLIRARNLRDAAVRDLVTRHIAAIDQLVAEHIEGDGGLRGRAILAAIGLEDRAMRIADTQTKPAAAAPV
jgi:hypothetical protein